MTPATFKTRFPEFASETDPRIQFFIDDAAPFFDVERWDDLYEIGIAYFVAHELSLSNARIAAGGAAAADDETSVTAGDLSYTRSAMLVAAQSENEYLKTAYGQKYLKFSKRIGKGGVAL